MERRKNEKFVECIPDVIRGMALVEARRFCTGRGYVLRMVGDKVSHHATYLVTVVTIDDKGIIKEAKYGE